MGDEAGRGAHDRRHLADHACVDLLREIRDFTNHEHGHPGPPSMVLGQPMPTDFSVAELESLVVTQRVDLTTSSAGPLQTLARDPVATTTAGTAVLSLSTAGMLSISDPADAASATVRSVNVSALLGPDASPGALGYDPIRARLAIGTEFGDVLLAEFEPTSSPGTPSVLIRRISTEGDPPLRSRFRRTGRWWPSGGISVRPGCGSAREPHRHRYLGRHGAAVGRSHPATRSPRRPAESDTGAGAGVSPDGTVLASTTEFATTRLWSAVTGAPIGGDLVAGAAPITIAAIPEPERPEIPFTPSFSANGLVLFTGSDHPMVWSLDPTNWRIAACAIAGRELTPNEWALYLPGRPARRICARALPARANKAPTRRSHSRTFDR